ncbi:20065_t:CDS:2 [Racocetra persica]|uniref:20065_t:CDS:1 n=1 Tax=Racocetra persica TaxID=160502 RepID=A0ACA9KWR0_9GLOM|nr:20065_t:CDS:2 [Racocetra persica]
MNKCENYSSYSPSSTRPFIFYQSSSISASAQSNNSIQPYKQSLTFSQQRFINPSISTLQNCLFTIVPIEIFIIICSHLTPWDLLSLLKTCRKFHNYLCSSISSTTHLIWRSSRLNTIFFPKIPPPEGLNEREYCCILMIEKGCQFCGRNGCRDVRIYWTFRVRSCWDCLMKRTVCVERGNEIPEYASGLPFTKFRLNGMYGSEYIVFWADSVTRAKYDFDNLSETDRTEWIRISKQRSKEIEIDSMYREKLDQELYDLAMYHKKCQILLYYELLASESSPNGKILYNRYFLDMCPSLNEVMLLPNHLFARLDYDSWKIKMLEEYRNIELERRIIPKRYNQIKERLVYSPLYKRPAIYWIQYCPTYKSPPYHNNDARIPWNDKFLDSVLIPRIMTEATLCAKQADDAVLVLKFIEDLLCMRIRTVRDALVHGLGNVEMFRCNLCGNVRSNDISANVRFNDNNGDCDNLRFNNSDNLRFNNNNDNLRFNNNSGNWRFTGNNDNSLDYVDNSTMLYNYVNVKQHIYLKHWNWYQNFYERCEDICIEIDMKMRIEG